MLAGKAVCTVASELKKEPPGKQLLVLISTKFRQEIRALPHHRAGTLRLRLLFLVTMQNSNYIAACREWPFPELVDRGLSIIVVFSVFIFNFFGDAVEVGVREIDFEFDPEGVVVGHLPGAPFILIVQFFLRIRSRLAFFAAPIMIVAELFIFHET